MNILVEYSFTISTAYVTSNNFAQNFLQFASKTMQVEYVNSTVPNAIAIA